MKRIYSFVVFDYGIPSLLKLLKEFLVTYISHKLWYTYFVNLFVLLHHVYMRDS